MPLSRTDAPNAAAACVYVAWLTAFPMSGVLLQGMGDMLWFLMPHTLALFALGHGSDPARSRVRIPGAAALLLTALLTAAAPLVTLPTGTLLVLLGIISAPVSLRMGQHLGAAERPVPTAALALAAGNLLALALILTPLPDPLRFLLLALSLAFLAPEPRIPPPASPPRPRLYTYLPFILVFQLVSGLMYAGLLPAYAAHAALPGIEVTFYGLGALGAVVVLQRFDPAVTLLGGVIAALTAFSLWHLAPTGFGVQGALFLMMIAAGTVDLFLLSRVLAEGNLQAAYGRGVGTLCLGIVLGRLLALSAGEAADTLAFIGLMLLNLSALILVLPLKRHQAGVDETPPTPAPADIPGEILQRLSEQERLVLEQVLGDKTYREIASGLSISESSVKTYMHRIYRKTGVYRRHQLLQQLRAPESGPSREIEETRETEETA
ncbi:helix-turn-helix transcriptional regulator [Ectothiorhodospira mobilis]|uniref:helix-turn-helix transcriptional regulator n=1 Tax=Ectothiorhodospira mobilis TaxID=195064 RepID=UPI001EE81748|nr:LuxR C-terminal-related transcriptional regulator [Ectothiorhodospira mobilis]MCG5535230.1 helix-turn-helix transcriptional regulator [Ectothiorhodospira mobilis]